MGPTGLWSQPIMTVRGATYLQPLNEPTPTPEKAEKVPIGPLTTRARRRKPRRR